MRLKQKLPPNEIAPQETRNNMFIQIKVFFLIEVVLKQQNISNITTDDKTQNGEETGDSENVATEEEEAVISSCYYDKTKSFFDNLSSENSRYIHSYHILTTYSQPKSSLDRNVISKLRIHSSL